MPHRNTIRHYVENGIYHVYNRGVEKRTIFVDDQDYAIFLHLLKYYLSPLNKKDVHPMMKFQSFSVRKLYPLKNLNSEVELLAYCLMPNHFHLLIRQITKDGVTKLLRKISTTYAMYFNKRYKRVGYLFQGKYKAALVETDYYLLHLSRYIHLNPIDLQGSDPFNYEYSSYKYYLGKSHTSWIKINIINSFFDRKNLLPFLKKYPSYQQFVENYSENSRNILKYLTLE